MKQDLLQSIAKAWFRIRGHIEYSSKGFSLIEAILASGILALLVTAFVGAWLYGLEATTLSGNRARAVYLAEEALEAAHNIKDNSFSNLINGTFGLIVSGNQYVFSGSSDTTGTSVIFTRQVTISTINASTKQISSTVTWPQNLQRNGLVTLVTYLTNWAASTLITTCNQYCQSQSFATGTCRGNAGQCTANGETYQSGGDIYCSNPTRRCCCHP